MLFKKCHLAHFLVFVSIAVVAVEFVGGTCTKGAIRYDPEYNNTVIQICFANRWGYICANGNEGARQRIANVICQQMGYSNHSYTGMYRSNCQVDFVIIM